MDSGKNFAKSNVSTGYTNAATSIVLATGGGAKMPAVPFNAVWWDTAYYDPSDDPNVEIVRVTNVSSDTLTITRGQESTSAVSHNTAGHTYRIIAGLTAKTLTDITADIAAASQAASFGAYGVTVPPTAANSISTFLNGAINNAVTSLVVTSAVSLPAVPFPILIDTEEMKVTNVSGTTLTVTRGYDSTSAASHSDGATVTVVNWMWNNQGAATLTDYTNPSRLILQAPAVSGTQIRMIKRFIKNLSSGSLVVGWSSFQVPGATSTLSMGLTMRESGTDKRSIFNVYSSNNGPLISIVRGSGPTLTSAVADFGAVFCTPGGPMIWQKIAISGANYIYSISNDPSSFIPLVTVAKTIEFTSAADEWGFFVNTGTTVCAGQMVVLSYVET